LYNDLRYQSIHYLEDFINEDATRLSRLKGLFRGELPVATLEGIQTVDQLWTALEEHGELKRQDVAIIKWVAEALQLNDLEERVDDYESKTNGKN